MTSWGMMGRLLGGVMLLPVLAGAASAAGLVTTKTTTFSYDAYGNPTQVTEVTTDGVESFTATVTNTVENDAVNWLIGRVTQTVVAKTNPDGTSQSRTKSRTYQADSFLVAGETQEPGDPLLEVSSSFTYDAFGNVTQTTISAAGVEPRSSTTSWSADGRFALSQSNALGQSGSATYDPRFGAPLTKTDANGIVTSWTYDGFGRPLTQVNADGTETRFSYDLCSVVGSCPAGAVERVQQKVVDAASGTAIAAESIAYIDKLGRTFRTESQDADGVAVYQDTVFDTFGRVIKTSRPYRSGETIRWAESAYDVLDRVVTVTQENGAVTTTSYDGLTVSVLTPLNETESRKMNAIGQLARVTDTAGGTVDYDYDPFGNLIRTTDALGNQVTIAYDRLGRKVAMDDPDMGYWSYGYNAYGELTSQTDAKGQTVSITYDKLGRMTQRVDGEGTSTWTYDTALNGIGLLHRAQGPAALPTDAQPQYAADYQETHSYDGLSRPVSTTRTIRGKDYTTSLVYDAYSRLDSVNYPSGFAVSYHYSQTGFLQEIVRTSDQSLLWRAESRNAEGEVLSATLGNGLTEYTQRDELGRVTNRSLTGAGTGTQLDLAMTYDLAGNLLSREDKVVERKEVFTYDQLNRLTQTVLLDNNNPTQISETTYAYDIIGNLTYKSDLAGGGMLTYDGLRPHAVNTARGATFTYDMNGNILFDGERNVTWTSFNKPDLIAKVDQQTATSTAFVYGPDRARIRQQIRENGTVTEVAYVGSYFEERSPINDAGGVNGTVEQLHYIRAGDASLAIHKIEIKLDATTTQTTKWYALDHIGSIVLTTDELGQASERTAFDPHGKRREADWLPAALPIRPVDTPRGFTGHEMLDTVGIIHMNGRVYDPDLGRFLSPDPNIPEPLVTQDFNRYSYVRNNPLSYTDPTGFQVEAGMGASWGDNSPGNRERDYEGTFVHDKNGNRIKGTNGSVRAGRNKKSWDDRHRAIELHNLSTPMHGYLEALAFYGPPKNVYHAKWSDTEKGWSYSAVSGVYTRYAAINGMLNDLDYAIQLMGEHIRRAYGQNINEFTLFHNPTQGFWADLMESFKDKIGLTTDIAKQFAGVLANVQAVGKDVGWVAHSQGGAIFSEAVRYYGNNLSHHTVAFHAGANNRTVTAGILGRAGVTNLGHLDHPYDPVPNIAGFNTVNPFKIVGSLLQLPNLIYGSAEDSPHTLPYNNGTYAH